MDWWMWAIFGLAAMAAELATPGGFYFLFFGVAALIVSLLTGLGVGGPEWLQWLLFSVLSVLALVLLRGPLQARMLHSAGAEVDSLIGESVILLEDLAPGAIGKAELRGTSWTTRNAGDEPLSVGRRCRVERVERLTLWVRGE